MGAESLTHLKKLASNVTGGGAGAGLDGSAGKKLSTFEAVIIWSLRNLFLFIDFM